MAGRSRYLVALLFEAGLEAEVNGLRRALGSSQLQRIPPHITLVPPTNVSATDDASVMRIVVDAAAVRAPFEVELGPPATFSDNRSVLFLSVRDGQAALEGVREELLKGPFADRREVGREFVPHVTLYSGREPKEAETLLEALASFRESTTIGDIALLQQDELSSSRPWSVVCRVDLGTAAELDRAGGRIVLSSGSAAAAWMRGLYALWGIEADDRHDVVSPTSCALAFDGDAVVAAATFSVAAFRAELCSFAVKPSVRRLGIGSTMLRYLEQLLIAKGVDVVTARVGRGSDLAGLLSAKGWVQLPDVFSLGNPNAQLLARRLRERSR